MSVIAVTLTLMTDQLSTADRVYFAIASLRGWESPLSLYQHYSPNDAYRVGRLVSSILVAADDDREPLAVSGEADDAGTGTVSVVYPDFVVVAKATGMDVNAGEFNVFVHPLNEAKDLRVETSHSFYTGVDSHPRYRGIGVSFTVGGEKVVLAPTQSGAYGDETLVGSKAVHDAYLALRDAVTGANTAR